MAKNIKLIVDNKELELSDNIQISLNYAIQDILDMKKRKTNFSKTIVLEGTDINNEFFEHIYDVNISTLTFNPRLKIPARILAGMNELFVGSLNLLKITNNNDVIRYEVAIIGSLSNVYKELKGKDISFIDLSDLSHIRNKQTIIDSWTNTEGYIYPHIVYGNKDNVYNEFYIYDLQPSIYVKTIFDRMINELGYTYNSNFLNSDYFKSLILTSNNEKILKPDSIVDEQRVYVGVDGPHIDDNGAVPSLLKYAQIQEYPTPSAGQVTTTSNFNREAPYIDSFGVTVPYSDTLNQNGAISVDIQNTGYYNIDLNCEVFRTVFASEYVYSVGNPLDVKVSINILRTDGSQQQLDFITDSSPVSNAGASIYTSRYIIPNAINIDLNAQNIFLEVGDTVFIMYETGAAGLNFRDVDDLPIGGSVGIAIFDESPNQNLSSFRVEPSNQSMGFEEIEISNLFNLKLDDLFDDIVKMFNLVIIEDDYKNLTIETYDDYFSSRSLIKDWTDKVDRNKVVDILPLNKLDYNKYTLEYSQGKDWLNDRYFTKYKEGYGSKIINIENDFSKKEESLKLKFEATPNSNQFMSNRSVPFLCDIVDEITNWQFKQKKTKNRILFVKSGEVTDEWFLKENVADNTTSFTEYVYCGMFDSPKIPEYSLSFGNNKEEYNTQQLTVPTNNLTNQFHINKIQNIIHKDARLMVCYIHLSELDIKDFDFRDIIFIDGSYWRVDKIEDFNPNTKGTSKVTLYKLLDELTQNNINLTIGQNNQSCPNDIEIHNGQYISKGEITKECCNALGGSWNSVTNTCSVIQPPSGGGLIEDAPPIINKGNLVQHNGNSINSPGAIVNGSNNYIGSNSNVTAVLGNNNTVGDNVSNIFIAGDNINASNSDTTYVNNIVIQGGISGIDILWQDLIDLITLDAAEENAVYNITDRNITLETLTSSTYKPLCKWIGEVVQSQIYDAVQDYPLLSGRNYRTHQIWDTNSTVILPDFVGGNPNYNGVIWNGKMWMLDTTLAPIAMNLTDEPGTSSQWTEVLRPVDVNANTFYYFSNEQKGFVISYDLLGDRINVVWDDRGNKINSYLINNVKLNDFGCDRIYGNDCGPIYNNVTLNDILTIIFNNSCIGPIFNNSNSGNIYLNSNGGNVSSNSNIGHIFLNSNGGDVSSNSNGGDVFSNSNSGKVYGNSNSVSVFLNSNGGNVSSNSNSGYVYLNSNTGHISLNNNGGDVYLNTNNGHVHSNSNSGYVYSNSNNGNVYSNSNNGNVYLNSNVGHIQSNLNSGDIFRNSNNGDISGVPSTNINIENNTNNGNINGLLPGNISDPIVNK